MIPRRLEASQATLKLVTRIAEELSDAFQHDSAVFTIKSRWVGQPPKGGGTLTRTPQLRVKLIYGGTDEIVINLIKRSAPDDISYPDGAFRLIARLFAGFSEKTHLPSWEVLRILADQLEAEERGGD